MPDSDFELSGADDVLDDRPTTVNDSSAGRKPRGSGGPTALKITRSGRSVTIGFLGQEIVNDERCLAAHRDQLLQVIDDPDCDVVTFDLTGVKIVLSGMLGLLISARNRGREVELLNPSPEFQEILRTTRRDTVLLIRGSAS
jgi:anti-sigma B factor antagonist